VLRQSVADGDEDGDVLWLDESQYALVRQCADDDITDLLDVTVGTGMRWGEVTALRVRDLRLDDDVPLLIVRRAWKKIGDDPPPRKAVLHPNGKHYLGVPKSKKSIRRITLAPLVVEVLRRAVAGKGQDEFVFTAPRGGPLDHAHFYEDRWQPTVAKARKKGLLSRPRFHDLRHTHAVWLISAGVPLPVIQQRLGHQSIQTTVDVYGGFLPQTSEAADAAITAALGGGKVRLHLLPAHEPVASAVREDEAGVADCIGDADEGVA
jgi:integrase